MMRLRRIAGRSVWTLASIAMLLLVGCGPIEPAQHRLLAPQFVAVVADAGGKGASGDYPQKLSQWQLMQWRGDRLVLPVEATHYELATPLFSDYAHKLRVVYLPEPGAVSALPLDAKGRLQFPLGTIIAKTFFYRRDERGVARTDIAYAPAAEFSESAGGQLTLDRRHDELLETRLLVRQEHGWDALPYVWEGDDASLAVTGVVRSRTLIMATNSPDLASPVVQEEVEFAYVVPSRNECASCHATDHSSGVLQTIGLNVRHLRGLPSETGDVVPWPPKTDTDLQFQADAPLDARARAYLDINCGHCHNPNGAADTSGLMLDRGTQSVRALGFCKPPIAAGAGTGGRPYSVVPGSPDKSILLYRMQTINPAQRMPELGRSLMHREGVELIRAWIESQKGGCDGPVPEQKTAI